MVERLHPRRLLAGIALAVAFSAALSSATAAAPRRPAGAQGHPRTRKLDVSWVASVVISGNPRIIAGATTGTLGQGAVVYRAQFVPGPIRQTAFSFQLRLYYERGLVRALAYGIGVDAPDGRELFSGSVKIVGGTGVFRRARGSAKLSGDASAFNDQTHLRLTHQRITGSIAY
jgi:hypothetical protein